MMTNPRKAKNRQLMADISSNNGSYNAAAYASAGHLMIAIKATQGTGYLNPFWRAWTLDSHQERLAVTHYHFAGLGDPIAEARFFWQTVRPHYKPHYDRLALDIETGPRDRWQQFILEFEAEVHRLAGLQLQVYTFASAAHDLHSSTGRWWVASWGPQRPRVARRQKLWAWQYTDGQIDPTGAPTTCAGIGRCDVSVLSNELVRNLARQSRPRRLRRKSRC